MKIWESICVFEYYSNHLQLFSYPNTFQIPPGSHLCILMELNTQTQQETPEKNTVTEIYTMN